MKWAAIISVSALLAGITGGVLATRWYYKAEIASIQQAQSLALAEATEEYRHAEQAHAQKLADAVDKIDSLSRSGDDLKRQRDDALDRVRELSRNRRASAGGKADTGVNDSGRLARCEDLLRRMAETGSRGCDLLERTAVKHDAVVELVR